MIFFFFFVEKPIPKCHLSIESVLATRRRFPAGDGLIPEVMRFIGVPETTQINIWESKHENRNICRRQKYTNTEYDLFFPHTHKTPHRDNTDPIQQSNFIIFFFHRISNLTGAKKKKMIIFYKVEYYVYIMYIVYCIMYVYVLSTWFFFFS